MKAERGYELEVKSYLLMAEENEEVAFFRATIHDLQSAICYLLGGKNLSGRFGAAGPHRPTGERDKISRGKNPEKNGLLRTAIYDL